MRAKLHTYPRRRAAASWLQAIKSKFNFCANADRDSNNNNSSRSEDNAKEAGGQETRSLVLALVASAGIAKSQAKNEKIMEDLLQCRYLNLDKVKMETYSSTRGFVVTLLSILSIIKAENLTYDKNIIERSFFLHKYNPNPSRLSFKGSLNDTTPSAILFALLTSCSLSL